MVSADSRELVSPGEKADPGKGQAEENAKHRRTHLTEPRGQELRNEKDEEEAGSRSEKQDCSSSRKDTGSKRSNAGEDETKCKRDTQQKHDRAFAGAFLDGGIGERRDTDHKHEKHPGLKEHVPEKSESTGGSGLRCVDGRSRHQEQQ